MGAEGTLNGKVALVSGASRGLGRATAVELAAAGAYVVCTARSTRGKATQTDVDDLTLEGTLDAVRAAGGDGEWHRCDHTEPDQVEALLRDVLERHGRVDVLVNNVGAVRIRTDGFLGTSDDEFEWALRMNFFTALRAIRATIPVMVQQGGGAIVNVASVNAFFQPDAGTIDYGAAKAALLNLSKSLAQEFGAKGIHVNCVSPGPVATELWLGDHGVAATVAAASGVDVDTARANVVESIGGFATGRFTTPEEVATLVVLLASDRTANVTGANYVIDGGLIKTT